MNKRQTIDEILRINLSAEPAFLARFGQGELDAYLTHLQVLRQPRLSGDRGRFDKYFQDCPVIDFVACAGTEVERAETPDGQQAPAFEPLPAAACDQAEETISDRPEPAQGLLFST